MCLATGKYFFDGNSLKTDWISKYAEDYQDFSIWKMLHNTQNILFTYKYIHMLHTKYFCHILNKNQENWICKIHESRGAVSNLLWFLSYYTPILVDQQYSMPTIAIYCAWRHQCVTASLSLLSYSEMNCSRLPQMLLTHTSWLRCGCRLKR